MAARDDKVVVKLGGSLLHHAAFGEPLGAILAATGRIVIVPGGGPFADAVREAQRLSRFSDGLAHRLAIRAMSTVAEILCDSCPRLVLAPTRSAIDATWKAGLLPVWDASELIGHPDIPESWDVTSDSLAAWLAGTIDAEALILVKSALLRRGRTTVQDLIADAVLDPAFQRFSTHITGRIVCVGRQGWTHLGDIVDGDRAGLAIQSAGPA
jgi:aspartokinase-like uncharacterized kinase